MQSCTGDSRGENMGKKSRELSGHETLAGYWCHGQNTFKKVQFTKYIVSCLEQLNRRPGPSVGPLVGWTQLTIKPFTTLPSDPRDL